MTPTLLAIADDLTGASDTGVRFGDRGIPTMVTLEPVGRWRDAAVGHDVLVVTTDSRHLDAAAAAARVREAVSWARAAGVPHVYKKVDSTLRGNIGSELEACLVASGARTLPFLPAFPALGRTTRNGRLYVDGHPLERSAVADDPLEPVRGSGIAEVVRAQTGLPMVVAAPARLDSDEALPAGIVVIDAETDDDLVRAGRGLARRGLLGVSAGSGGFAAVLAGALDLPPVPQQARPYPERMLVVCGSVSDVAMDQCGHAVADGMHAVHVPPELLLAETVQGSPLAQDVVAAVAAWDRSREDVLLRTAVSRRDLEACLALGARAGLDARSVHRGVVERIAALAGLVLDRTRFDLLVAVGGDTFAALARGQLWRGLRPVLEPLPGVPLSVTVGGRGPAFVVSKAGAFGPPDVLARLRRALRRVSP